MLPLVAIDVDGTLVGPSGRPTDAVWAAAEAARHRGQHLALCTARLARGNAWEWARRLDPDGWHIFHAGAALVHGSLGANSDRVETTKTGASAESAEGGSAVQAQDLSGDQVLAFAKIASDEGWTLEFYTATDYTVADDTRLAVEHAALMGLPHLNRPRSELNAPIVRVQFVVPIEQTEAVLAHRVPGTLGTAATSPVMADAAFVSFVSDRASKGRALAILADKLGTELSRVMMVGDGHNDLDAIEAAGHGVAMGNADPRVIAAADHQVATVDNDGLVEALTLSATL